MSDPDKKILRERLEVMNSLLIKAEKAGNIQELVRDIKEEIWVLRTKFGLWDKE